MEPYILEVENLTAAFGSREVLSGIGCKIRRGRKTAVVGESGSGKTVFAQSIMRLNPDLALKGRLNFDGEDVLQAAPQNRHGVPRADDRAQSCDDCRRADCRSADPALGFG